MKENSQVAAIRSVASTQSSLWANLKGGGAKGRARLLGKRQRAGTGKRVRRRSTRGMDQLQRWSETKGNDPHAGAGGSGGVKGKIEKGNPFLKLTVQSLYYKAEKESEGFVLTCEETNDDKYEGFQIW